MWARPPGSCGGPETPRCRAPRGRGRRGRQSGGDRGWPSSGRSAISVRAVTGPMPGTERSRSSVARHAGVDRMRVVRSSSSRRRASSSHAMWASSCRRRRRSRRRRRRLSSAPSMSTSWRRRATRSRNASACSSGTGRAAGAHRLREERDAPRIQRVGLGELPGGAGEVPDLPWIDDRDGEAGSGQGGGGGGLVASGGFEHDHGGR